MVLVHVYYFNFIIVLALAQEVHLRVQEERNHVPDLIMNPDHRHLQVKMVIAKKAEAHQSPPLKSHEVDPQNPSPDLDHVQDLDLLINGSKHLNNGNWQV